MKYSSFAMFNKRGQSLLLSTTILNDKHALIHYYSHASMISVHHFVLL